MSILWYEGFDQYGPGQFEGTPTQGLWADFGLAIFAAGGSLGGIPIPTPRTGLYQAGTQNGGARRSLKGDKTTVGIGTGFYMGNLPFVESGECAIMQFRDVNNKCHIHITIGTTGRIQVFRGGFDGRLVPSGTWAAGGNPGILGESTLELAAGTWNHVECKVVFDTAVGSVKVIVNGDQTFINLTNINTTSNQADFGTCSQVAFGKFDSFAGFPMACAFWDDIFVYDQNTAGVHDFLGEYGVYALFPNADDATHHDWQLTSGIHGYALINEVPPDDALNFIFSTTVNDRSDFGVSPLPSNITAVAAVMPCIRGEKTDTGNCDFAAGVTSSGTNSLSGNVPFTTSWTYYEPEVFEQDPATAAPWSVLGANAALLSVKRTV